MPSPEKIAAWGKLYQQRRRDGASGWAGDDSYQRKQTQIIEALQGHSQAANARFLELGCGAGNITLWMAAQGYEAYGIDIVPAAIAWANARMRHGSWPANFRVGDITHMTGFPDAFFDIIFDADCFHMIIEASRSQGFAEVRRVLKPGGLFIRGQNVRNDCINERVEFAQGTAYFEPQNCSIYVEGRQEYLLLSETELVEEIINAGFEILRVMRRPAAGRKPFLAGWVDVCATQA